MGEEDGVRTSSVRFRSDLCVGSDLLFPITGGRQRYTDDLSMKNHVVADKSLCFKDGLPAIDFGCLGHKNQTVAKLDFASKTDLFHPAKTEKPIFDVGGFPRRRPCLMVPVAAPRPWP